jgi:hypothetical protein
MMIRGSANQLTNEQQSAQQPSDTQHLAQAVVNQQPAMTTVRCNCSQSCVLWGMLADQTARSSKATLVVHKAVDRHVLPDACRYYNDCYSFTAV